MSEASELEQELTAIFARHELGYRGMFDMYGPERTRQSLTFPILISAAFVFCLWFFTGSSFDLKLIEVLIELLLQYTPAVIGLVLTVFVLFVGLGNAEFVKRISVLAPIRKGGKEETDEIRRYSFFQKGCANFTVIIIFNVIGLVLVTVVKIVADLHLTINESLSMWANKLAIASLVYFLIVSIASLFYSAKNLYIVGQMMSLFISVEEHKRIAKEESQK